MTRSSTFIKFLAATLLACTALGACGKGEPSADDSGMAAGVASKQSVLALWQRLSRYQSGYLRAWKDALADPDPSARDVLDAFNELNIAVTGAGGFWRKTVPEQWFGCVSDANSMACKALTDAAGSDFKEWDQFQAESANVSDAQTMAFLAKNQKRMTAYLDTWVPDAPNMTAMKATGFYKDKLGKAIGVSAGAADDL